jgi:hypothetical protein
LKELGDGLTEILLILKRRKITDKMKKPKTGKFKCNHCEAKYRVPKIQIFQERTMIFAFTEKDITDIEHYPKQFAVICTNCNYPNFVTDKMSLVLEYLGL